jgi:zinc protease
MDVLTEWTAEGVDLQTGYEETVKSLTSEKLQKFLADLVSAGNHAEIVMMPEK